jgi:hypothetical protein
MIEENEHDHSDAALLSPVAAMSAFQPGIGYGYRKILNKI